MAKKGVAPTKKLAKRDDGWDLPEGYGEVTPTFENHDGWVHPSEGLRVTGKLKGRRTMTTSNGEGAFYLVELTKEVSVMDADDNEVLAEPGQVVAVVERQGTKIMQTLAMGTPVIVEYVEKIQIAGGKTWWKTRVAADRNHPGNDIPF